MRTRLKGLGVSAALVVGIVALATASSGQPISVGQKVKMDGVITSRDGANMTVKSSDRGNVVVVLTDSSDVTASKGGLGLFKKGVAVTALIPGLKLSVEGVGDEKGRLIATKVHFTEGDLKTAQAIQAGLSPTESKLQATDKQVQANQQGIQQVKSDEANLAQKVGEMGQYDTKAQATVYFAVGSTAISADGQRDLGALAVKAKALQGYLVEVEGFADSSGNAATNEKLSEERSQAVVNWLAQSGGISFLHMLAPGAMGTSDPVASNETSSGRAENRRVVVTVVVNRGMQP